MVCEPRPTLFSSLFELKPGRGRGDYACLGSGSPLDLGGLAVPERRGEPRLPGPRSPAGIIREILSAPWAPPLVMGRCDREQGERKKVRRKGGGRDLWPLMNESLWFVSGFGVSLRVFLGVLFLLGFGLWGFGCLGFLFAACYGWTSCMDGYLGMLVCCLPYCRSL